MIVITSISTLTDQEKQWKNIDKYQDQKIFKVLPISLIRQVDEREIKDENHELKKNEKKNKAKCNLHL